MITEQNYYAVNNRGLSQSKIKMYKLDPNYMYRSCISGELVREDTEAFKIGREVDSILTEMDKSQNTVINTMWKDFHTKEAREWKANLMAQGKTVVSQKEYDKIMATAIAVQSTTIWKHIEKTCTFQKILTIKSKQLGPHFDQLYGKLDAFSVGKDGICDLYDLKTAAVIDEKKFFYKAKDYGYFSQLCFYSNLLKANYKNITSFRYWFVVAEKAEPYRVNLFSVPSRLVDKQWPEIDKLIQEIANNKTFAKPDVSFDTAIELNDPSESFEDLIEDLVEEE